MTALKRCNCGWEDDVKMYLTERHNICKVEWTDLMVYFSGHSDEISGGHWPAE